MKSLRILCATIVGGLLVSVAGCGGGSNGAVVVIPPSDAFVGAAIQMAANSPDDTEPVSIDVLVATAPEDTEPVNL